MHGRMKALYAARLGDLGPSDLVKVRVRLRPFGAAHGVDARHGWRAAVALCDPEHALEVARARLAREPGVQFSMTKRALLGRQHGGPDVVCVYSGDCDQPFRLKVIADSGDRPLQNRRRTWRTTHALEGGRLTPHRHGSAKSCVDPWEHTIVCFCRQVLVIAKRGRICHLKGTPIFWGTAAAMNA